MVLRLLIAAALALLAHSASADTKLNSPITVGPGLGVTGSTISTYIPQRCDAISASDGAITSGSAVFTSASASFVAGDVGKAITVNTAGARQKLLSLTVSAAGSNYIPGSVTQLSIGDGVGTPGSAFILSTKVVSATVAAGGTGGTPGTATVTGTTGTATIGGARFSASVTIGGGGNITSVDSITVAGSYTAGMENPAAEPVQDGANLTGATLNVVTGVLTAVPMLNLGLYTTVPSVAFGQTSDLLGGSGATFTATYFHEALATTIASVEGPTSITLALPNASGSSLTGRYWAYGTDQTSTIQGALDAGIPVMLPPDDCMAGPLTMTSGRVMTGFGIGSATTAARKSRLIYWGEPTSGQITADAGAAATSGIVFGNVELDGAGQALHGFRGNAITIADFPPLLTRNHTTFGVALDAYDGLPVQDVNFYNLFLSENGNIGGRSVVALALGAGTPATSNVNGVNIFRLRAASLNGVSLWCGAADSNWIGNARIINNGDFSTTMGGAELRGRVGGAIGNTCVENVIEQINASAGGMRVRGAGFDGASTRNQIGLYAIVNGAGPVVTDKRNGAFLTCSTDSDNEGCDSSAGISRFRLLPASKAPIDYTVVKSDAGTLFSNSGAPAASNRVFTLPPAGDVVGFWACYTKWPQGDRVTVTPSDALDTIEVSPTIQSSAGTGVYTEQDWATICPYSDGAHKWVSFSTNGAWIGDTVATGTNYVHTASQNPTGTTNTTGHMMGMGSVAVVTPIRNGRVWITMRGSVANSDATGGSKVLIAYGTGTAPSNNAAATGTLCGPFQSADPTPAANTKVPFSVTCLATGLTLGTTYWIDAELAAVTAGTATISATTISAHEISN